MNFIASLGVAAFCSYVIMVISIHESFEPKVLACSQDYKEVPVKYKKLCVKEYKNELQERRKQYYY